MYLQILQEPHGAAWSHRVNFKYYRSRMETLSIRFRDAWSRMEPHGAACSHRFNFIYYRSRMETLSIRFRDAWNRMEPHRAAWSRMEPHGAATSRMQPLCKLQILQEPYGERERSVYLHQIFSINYRLKHKKRTIILHFEIKTN